MKNAIRHWWWNLQWVQRLVRWRRTKVPISFGAWSVWATGDVVLHRVYWRGWWTPLVRVKPRYSAPRPPPVVVNDD